eukprot:g868.t1
MQVRVQVQVQVQMQVRVQVQVQVQVQMQVPVHVQVQVQMQMQVAPWRLQKTSLPLVGSMALVAAVQLSEAVHPTAPAPLLVEAHSMCQQWLWLWRRMRRMRTAGVALLPVIAAAASDAASAAAARNGPAAEAAEGNALLAEAAVPKTAVADQTEENAALEMKTKARTSDFDFDISDSDTDGHQRDPSSRQEESSGDGDLCGSPKSSKKTAASAIRMDTSSASESDGDFCGDLFSKKLNLSEIRVDSSASSDSDSSWDDDMQAEEVCDQFEDNRFGAALSAQSKRLVQPHRGCNVAETFADPASNDGYHSEYLQDLDVHHSYYEQDLHHSLPPSSSNISDKGGTESNERRENRGGDQDTCSEDLHYTFSDNIVDSEVISMDRQTKRKYLARLTGPQSFKVKRRRISQSMQREDVLSNLDDSLSSIESSSGDVRSKSSYIKRISNVLPAQARMLSLESKLREFKSHGGGYTPKLREFFPIFQGNPPPNHPYPGAWNAKSGQPAYTQTYYQVDVEYAEPEPQIVTGVRLTDNATYTIKGVTKDGNGDLIFLINKRSQDDVGNPQDYQMRDSRRDKGNDIILPYDQARRNCSKEMCDYFKERVFMAARNIKSSESQLAIDRVYKDNILKELTLEREKVKSITDERDKLVNALKQVKSALKHEQELHSID